MAASILVVYYSNTYPVRSTIRDHLRSFAAYSGQRCAYLNAAHEPPGFVRRMRPDMVVFHTVFLSQRTAPEHFDSVVGRIAFLKNATGVKVALPQDEYVHTDNLNAFLDDFGVEHVFTIAPERAWPAIYPEAAARGLQLTQVLPGYLSDETVRKIDGIAATVSERDIEIGYRAWSPWACLGKHALLKGRISDLFRAAATSRGMRVDMSTDLADTILGDDWYRFLCRCKYTVGVEGGASILDEDGAIMDRTLAYLADHPDAVAEEVEAACFPGEEGSVDYRMLSPRHLEACATKTCQLLVEGDYSGVLEAGVHYIPVAADLGDVEQVLDRVEADEDRVAMVERAYRDIVASGRYSYRSFVEDLMRVAGLESPGAPKGRSEELLALRLNSWDKVWSLRVATKARLRGLAVRAVGEERVLWLMRGGRRALGRAEGGR